MRRRLLILGSTGSIGTQTIEVVEHLNRLHESGDIPMGFEVVGLAAGRNAALLKEQAERLGVRDIALADGNGASFAPDTRVRRGANAAETLVREVGCDLVLAAMVGVAGLPATLAAVELGRDIALANKETLVAAGGLVVPAAKRSGSKILPVDSEHAAVWQCLAGDRRADGDDPTGPGSWSAPPLTVGPSVRRVTLTASGGPFRTWSRERIENATPREALKHPTWSMGPKVTIDSASLMNKALEILEAHWLFGIPGERISAVIHPQSIVHSLVEFADGSSIAQLGAPDMRCPIQVALSYPHRWPGVCRPLDLAMLSGLEFEAPDLQRFPALGLAYDVIARGGNAGAVFNAANEAAVAAFLAGDRGVNFGRISGLVRDALAAVEPGPINSLDDVRAADALARAAVARLIG